MELHLVIQPDKDLIGQLHRQLRAAIQDGRLAAGEQLPPSRLLAERLGVSRKTVAEAYARLAYDGLAAGRVGSGTFVSAAGAPRSQPPARRPLAAQAELERWAAQDIPLAHPAPAALARYEYLGGNSLHSPFPSADWRRCLGHAQRQGAAARGLYGPPEGLPALRQAIARHIGYARGIRCSAEDIVVTNGTQQALDLIARVMLTPAATAAVEEPGYPPARLLFAAQGARVEAVPVDGQGLVAAAVPATARLIYTTPAHQMPLGMALSPARRQALLERAREIGALVVEDDYDSEFRYAGRPTDSLYSLDAQSGGGSVAFVGSFSKTLMPDLRLGYVVAPPDLRRALVAAKRLTDSHSPGLTQAALARFMDDGCLLKHIRRCHAIYARRRQTLERRFATDLAPWFELVPAEAGMHLAALARRPLEMDKLLRRARQRGLGLYSLAPFYAGPPRDGLLLGYAGIDTLDLEPSLDILRQLLETSA